MKVQIGQLHADSKSTRVFLQSSVAHLLESENVHDSQLVEKLIYSQEKRVYGDISYRGQKAKIKKKAP